VSIIFYVRPEDVRFETEWEGNLRGWSIGELFCSIRWEMASRTILGIELVGDHEPSVWLNLPG
jgi:hypothetical protein